MPIEIATGTEAEQQTAIFILVLDDERIDAAKLPGGAVGNAAIYTEHAKATHVIRRVELRMKNLAELHRAVTTQSVSNHEPEEIVTHACKQHP